MGTAGPARTGDASRDGGGRLFIVRVWSERVGEVDEPRGQVRSATSGAVRGFRTWGDLTSSMAELMAEQLQEPRDGGGA